MLIIVAGVVERGSAVDEMGELRRTHMCSQITKDLAGADVVIMGRVGDIRDLGGIKFFTLFDVSGSVQVTAPKARVGSEVLSRIDLLTQESSVALRGKVTEAPQAPRGVEVVPSEIRVLNLASVPLPLDPLGRVKANLDTRLDARGLDLRRPECLAIFRIRHEALQAIRECLVSRGFIEAQTPKIVATATESGASLFPVAYFEKEAFLSQSPQLYKEVLTGCFDRVFEVGPIFRAEEHDTPRHLNEATSVDIEAAYSTADDVMEVLEDVIVRAFERVKERCSRELEVLNHPLEVPSKPFRRITYDEALDILADAGVRIPWGEDLPTPAEKKLGEILSGPYFIVEWPLAIKPFYTMPHRKNPKLSESFDFMYGDLELASGGTRIHRADMLVKQLKEKGLNPENFSHHLISYTYGAIPPHAGWGLGLDRLTMVLTGSQNIRECVLFPRDRNRLVP